MENRSAALPRRGFDVTSSAFLIVAFLTGIAGALQTPTLSLFLTNEVHVRPAMVGFFFTGSAVIGILVSQFLAGRSDRQGDRKQLIVVCCLLGVLACVLFAWNRNYFVLLFIGVFLSSFGSTANPQMFALAREHADHTVVGRGQQPCKNNAECQVQQLHHAVAQTAPKQSFSRFLFQCF